MSMLSTNHNILNLIGDYRFKRMYSILEHSRTESTHGLGIDEVNILCDALNKEGFDDAIIERAIDLVQIDNEIKHSLETYNL